MIDEKRLKRAIDFAKQQLPYTDESYSNIGKVASLFAEIEMKNIENNKQLKHEEYLSYLTDDDITKMINDIGVLYKTKYLPLDSKLIELTTLVCDDIGVQTHPTYNLLLGLKAFFHYLTLKIDKRQ